MSRYSQGRALEHEVRHLFEGAGWSVIRGAGSKGEVDGMKVDLVATKKAKSTRIVYLIAMQCKRVKLG